MRSIPVLPYNPECRIRLDRAGGLSGGIREREGKAVLTGGENL